MPDRHAIANVALGWIGADLIRSFDDGSEESILCNNLYEDAVREVLQDHPWNFAEAGDALPKDAVAARPDYAFSYALPRPFCIPRFIMTLDGRRTSAPYKVMGNKLCTDLDGVYLVYTGRPPEQDFRPLFVTAVTHLLASRLAGPLTEAESKVQGHLQLYERAKAIARNRDSQEDSPEEVDTSLLVSVHHG